MGRRKGSKNKRGLGLFAGESSKKSVGYDFIGGVLIVIGIIFFVFFKFENAGVLATTLNEVFSGLFGIAKYMLPAVFVYLGLECILMDRGFSIVGETIKGLITMTLIASTIYIFMYDKFDIFKNVEEGLRWAYVDGIAGENVAGLVGAVVSTLMYKMVGLVGAKIIIVALTLFSSLYFLNVGFRQFLILIYNVLAAIVEWIINMFITVFEKDEDKIKEREEKRKLAQIEKIRDRDLAMALRNSDAQANLRDAKLGAENQLMFDLGTLDKNSEAAEKRDEFFKKQKEVKEEKDVKEVLQLDHIKHAMDEAYIFPPINLLQEPIYNDKGTDKKAIHETAVKLQKTLLSFGVDAKVTNITKGPTVTRYELTPNSGVKVSRIVNLSDDIALNLAAKSIRIEAPIPGRAAVGIEVPNQYNEAVYLRDVIASKEFGKAESKLTFAIGKDTSGNISLGDIGKMPHVLIAGATGSGKSVCINAIITSILYNSKPSEVKLILVDPKMVELSGYNGIPHLLIPVVTDPKKAAGALNWAVQEMVNRYTLFASKGVKDIQGYNKSISDKSEGVKLPQIVIIIDELADLMMVAPAEVEDAICRLAQMARAAGMHLVIATQRPSVDVITGIIKANIPSRIAFTVSSQIDSRTILDMAGAEKLLGKGDMLYFPVGEVKPQRMQGAFISEKEVANIVNFIKQNSQVSYNEDIIESIEKVNKKGAAGSECAEDKDELLEDAINLVIDMGQASASMLQRRFKIGYSRAGRIVDQMEMRGLVSGYDGSKPRNILISKEEWQELQMTEKENKKDTDN